MSDWEPNGDPGGILFWAWKGMGDDARMFRGDSSDGKDAHVRPDETGGLTSHSPALVYYGGEMRRAWKGRGDDARIFYGSGELWNGTFEQAPAVGLTSHGPALATANGPMRNALYLAWKGQGDDARMFYSYNEIGNPGWANQDQIGGLTSHGPALARGGAWNDLCLVWKGQGNDARMFSSTRIPGSIAPTWTIQREIGGLTSHGPALTASAGGGRLHRAWKGQGNDARMFYSFSDDSENWTVQRQVGGFTSHGPALAIGPYNRLFLAWKGQGDDARMFYSHTADGVHWTDQKQFGQGLTSHNPSLMGVWEQPHGGHG